MSQMTNENLNNRSVQMESFIPSWFREKAKGSRCIALK